jgi:hypothetical protein
MCSPTIHSTSATLSGASSSRIFPAFRWLPVLRRADTTAGQLQGRSWGAASRANTPRRELHKWPELLLWLYHQFLVTHQQILRAIVAIRRFTASKTANAAPRNIARLVGERPTTSYRHPGTTSRVLQISSRKKTPSIGSANAIRPGSIE